MTYSSSRLQMPGLAIIVLLAGVAMADGPVLPADAVARFTLPPGFSATLFAGEPDVVQPIAFTFDDRGRLWVIENHSYPGWKGEGRDRVVILEDRDGDGRFDRRRVFLENGNNLSGIEWGFGGVWLCSTPNLVFVADANGDDVPDGDPVVKLDGWDPLAQHNVSNSLAWGPDGWLYGCNGILSNSNVGKPAGDASARTAISCGVWRYHPTREQFEVVAHGTTNPWGLDFDENGQTFITNCVIEHLWHVVPGARFKRMFGQDFNPHSYALMGTCADHIHWAGGAWQEARGGERHDSHGGGHAHVGAMMYLGDNWPREYRNNLFTCNLHGNRINRDVLERQGSGYVAHHGVDFLHAGDPWFRGMTVKYGPDGGVFVSDWTDTGECHNYEVVDRSNGRIYKIAYGRPEPWRGDLASLSDAELVRLQTHANEWIVRHARRILQERGAAGRLSGGTAAELLALLRGEGEVGATLRALWALHAIGAADEPLLLECMENEHDVVRGWAVQLAVEERQASSRVIAKLVDLAAANPSPWVRLAVAAALQRIPLADRWAIVEGLAAHAEDAADANLTLMIWYGVEPLVAEDAARAIELARKARIPLIRQYIVRRIATADDGEGMASIVRLLARADELLRRAALAGMVEALQGRRRVAMPGGWPELFAELVHSEQDDIREPGLELALIFGDPQAFIALRKVAGDGSAEARSRQAAIAALAQANAPQLAAFLQSLLTDPVVRLAAIRGLAASQDEATAPTILKHYAGFNAEAKQAALSTLAARLGYALALLEAVERDAVPRGELSAFHVQQLLSLSDKEVSDRLTAIWGAVRSTAADRVALIAEHKQRLTPEALASADVAKGRTVFAKTCATCHRMFEEGGRIGPELTGSQRANLDYVLSNMLDPSAIVAKDYQITLLQTVDGRVVSGIVTAEDDHRVTLQTATEAVVTPKEDIEVRETSAVSMMPDGLLQSLSDDEVRDLVAYLASSHQVPLPKEAAK
ncbi:MAG: c-type cytochrome [Pirellulales bacterium]|nr:c-type cytochrome [Pirellulales bacterium]